MGGSQEEEKREQCEERCQRKVRCALQFLTSSPSCISNWPISRHCETHQIKIDLAGEWDGAKKSGLLGQFTWPVTVSQCLS